MPTQEEVDAAINEIETGAVTPGEPIVLTNQVGEIANGTDGNDEFSAVVDGTAGTLNVGDRLSGFAGRDTLNLTVVSGGIPAGVNISGIEVINLLQDAATLTGPINVNAFRGAEQVWQIDDAVAVTGVNGQTIGFRDTAVGATDTVTVADGTTSATVALDGVATGAAVTFLETTADDLTSVTVQGDVAGAGAVTVDTDGTTSVETINLALTSNGTVTLAADAAVLTTIDASASTGNLTIDATAITALESFIGGSGNDTLSIETGILTADALTVEAGAGNDTIEVDATAPAGTEEAAVSITGGAGSDSFVFTDLGNVVDASDFEASLITITDFDADEDEIDLGGVGDYDNLTNSQITAISAAADLDAALDLAATYTTVGDFTVFDFAGNAYVYFNAAAPAAADPEAFANGDGLIELTGVSVEDLTAQNFIV